MSNSRVRPARAGVDTRPVLSQVLDAGLLAQLSQAWDVDAWTKLSQTLDANYDNASPTDDQFDDTTDCLTTDSFNSDWLLWDKNKLEK